MLKITWLRQDLVHRFSELLESWGISSRQILVGRTDRVETTLEIMNRSTVKGQNVMMFTGADIVI